MEEPIAKFTGEAWWQEGLTVTTCSFFFLFFLLFFFVVPHLPSSDIQLQSVLSQWIHKDASWACPGLYSIPGLRIDPGEFQALLQLVLVSTKRAAMGSLSRGELAIQEFTRQSGLFILAT